MAPFYPFHEFSDESGAGAVADATNTCLQFRLAEWGYLVSAEPGSEDL